MTWLMTAALGLLLGLCLYGTVRVRNACLPWVRGTFGQAGYWLCWLTALALMLLAANIGIILVRQLVGLSVAEVAPLPREVCFTVVALLTGGSLAFRHSRNCRKSGSPG